MRKLKKTVKRRYLFFVLTTLLVIICSLIPIQNNFDSQNSDSHVINTVAKQLILFQNIDNILYDLSLNDKDEISKIPKLKRLTDEWEKAHSYLYSIEKTTANDTVLDSLIEITNKSFKQLLLSTRGMIKNPNDLQENIEAFNKIEPIYSDQMTSLFDRYQYLNEAHTKKLKYTIYFLSFVFVVILIVEFLFVFLPVYKQSIEKNNELVRINMKLQSSKEELLWKMKEVNQLKTDLEIQQQHNKIFIDQAPTAIAMLDNNMRYIAVSQRWIKDYNMEGQEIIGRSHYDLFPEIGDDWKEQHIKCLNGAIDICEEAPFKRKNGKTQWIYWDVRPWYLAEGKIGGIVMHTGDITDIKEKEKDKKRTEGILEKTNKVARIGTWELSVEEDEYHLSEIARELFGVPDDFEMNRKKNKSFYKEGESRTLITNLMNNCIENGIPFDVELEIETNNGSTIWVREIAQSEFVNGKCKRVFGILQDITSVKLFEKKLSEVNLQLSQVNTELKAILNTGPVAIISTDNNGIIKQFNYGAELLLGYSALEMIGKKEPEIFHLKEELDAFSINIAKRFGKDPVNFNPYLELTKNNISDSREWTFKRKDGSEFPVYFTLAAIKNEQNEKTGFLGIAIDITERKKVETELLRKNRLLVYAEEINKMGHWQWDVVKDKSIWSSNLYTILGFKEHNEDIKAETYIDCIHPEDKERFIKSLQKSIKDKRHYPIFHRVITKDGKIKIIHVLGEAILDEKGNLVELIGTCQDVTEQKMAENKFRGLLESAPDAMVIINKQKKIQLINKQAEKLLGYRFQELFNSSAEKLFENQLNKDFNNYFEEEEFLKDNAKVVDNIKELSIKNKTGNNIPVQISISPLQTEEGLLVSLAIRDISTQNEAKEKIIRAKDDLEVLAKKLQTQNVQLADFAQITSHNLRAPVSNLNSLLSIYQLAKTDEEKTILFEKFNTVIHHLTTTLDTLVNAIKTKSDTSAKKETISFAAVLKKTKDILRGEIIKSKAVIESDFSEVSHINYNKYYLDSIFLNILGNAIKYKHPDRAPKIIVKSSKSRDGKTMLTFSDNGLGINMDRHSTKLFGLNKTFHRHPEAKGVGLFMTKTQVEAMGGKISASSIVDEGTIFYVTL